MQSATKKLTARRKTLVVIIAAVVASVVLLTGVATIFANAPDTVTIRVTYLQPQTAHVVAQQTIGDSTQVQKIYQLVMHLPVTQSGIYNCPVALQTYYHYDLVFTRSGISVATMLVDTTSCAFLHIDTLVKWNNSTRIATASFWQAMQQQTQIDPFAP